MSSSDDADMNLSLIVGLRNNLTYSQAFYRSVRELYPSIEIVFVSYGSTDGTAEWLEALNDPFVNYYSSTETKTLSDTYNKGVSLATKTLVCYMHNDMIVGEGFAESLISSWKKGFVLCYTVVEPPIFIDDRRNWKVVEDFGRGIEDFDTVGFKSFAHKRCKDSALHTFNTQDPSFFLCVERRQLLEMGGLDPLFAPMFCEDDDLWLRFKLANIKAIQVPKALVYHFVSKTSRFSDEFVEKTKRIEDSSVRNFYRKWRFAPSSPIKKRYDIAAIVKNAKSVDLLTIEPYVGRVYIDENRKDYLESEQINTAFDMSKRVLPFSERRNHAIILFIDAEKFKDKDKAALKQLPVLIDYYYYKKRSFIRRFFFDKHDFKVGGIHFKIVEPVPTELSLINREVI